MTNDRSIFDPENCYSSEGLLTVEINALRVLPHLPDADFKRTRNAIEIASGHEMGIVVLVTPEAFEMRLPTVEWTMGAYSPASASRLWKRIRADRVSDKRLAGLIQEGLAVRRAEFVKCKYCGNLLPPEHRHGDVCHGCSERHDGVIH